MKRWTRRDTLYAGAALAGSSLLGASAQAQQSLTPVDIDLRTVTGPLDHIWSRCAGSDRAAMTLREGWRNDLERFHNEAGLERIRFHGIFSDELSVRSAGGTLNFQNVDAVYDGLLDRGVQPFVELSFMPTSLSSTDRIFGFYRANISPPRSMEAWGEFIQSFVRHLIERYSAAEVRQWYFEVWNEADLSFFWSGTQAEYFELYKTTAAAVKAVDPTLKVGGPATSGGHWLPEFLAYCSANNAPLDFVSTHSYAGDPALAALNVNNRIPATAAQARAQIDATPFRGLPLWLNEWGSDSPAMIAHVVTECLPHCYAMGQWQISGSYEEIRVADYVLKEGNNSWGMFAARNIAKPAFNTYKLMHRLGNQRLAATGPTLAARSDDGAAALVWNLADAVQPRGLPDATAVRTVVGGPKTLAVALRGARNRQRVRISYVDQERASPFPLWREMGSPVYPTREQLARIRASAEIAPAEVRRLPSEGPLLIDLPPEGIALIELD